MNYSRDNTQLNNELKWIEHTSKLLDSKFRIPGTSVRFGLDPIVGLLPVAGDIATMLISLMLIYTMYRHGASGKLIAKMILNVLVDFIFGSIPVFGAFFDVYFKANNRNVKLLKEHYEQGMHKGSAAGLILSVSALLLLLVAALVYLGWLFVGFLLQAIGL